MDPFTLTNLELRESKATGEQADGLSHSSMKGMVLLSVLELAASGLPMGAVTVVHDAGDTGARYKSLATALASNGWAVALPDLRGHGNTEGTRGHSAGLKEVWRDLAEIQNHLAYRMPDEPKVLIGQGLGALYCLSYCLESPGMVSTLVLVSPLHEPMFERPQAPGGLKKLFGGKLKDTDEGRIGWEGGQLVVGAEASEWASDPQTHDTITLRAIEQAQVAAAEYLPRARELDCPTLLIHGGADPISAADKSRALEGGSVSVQIFDELKHHPLQGEGSDAVHKAILGWLGSDN